jgi:hypothetical protein
VIHAYLGRNILTVQQLMGIALIITEMSGRSTFIISFVHCTNKAVLCSGNIVNHIGEEALNL